MKVAIVVPCHIPLSEAWIAALKSEADANKATVIIVDDSDGKLGALPEGWLVFGYAKQEEFLKELYQEFANIFHKSSSCRNFGHLYALKEGFDIIIGLDSDCIVKRNFVRDHVQFIGKDYGSGWFNPVGYPYHTRGYPYSQRNWLIMANMGLWENVLDINGKDRKANDPKEIKIAGSSVPSGPFPFSGMNFALAKDAVPGFFFLPNFESGEDKFRRIDDIWGGYIFEKLLRKMKWSTMVGYPFVFHDTIVDAEADAREEAGMYKFEDAFYDSVDRAVENMALHVTEHATMADLMLDFIINWNLEIDTDPFYQLHPAVDWWEQAIKKYA